MSLKPRLRHVVGCSNIELTRADRISVRHIKSLYADSSKHSPSRSFCPRLLFCLCLVWAAHRIHNVLSSKSAHITPSKSFRPPLDSFPSTTQTLHVNGRNKDEKNRRSTFEPLRISSLVRLQKSITCHRAQTRCECQSSVGGGILRSFQSLEIQSATAPHRSL